MKKSLLALSLWFIFGQFAQGKNYKPIPAPLLLSSQFSLFDLKQDLSFYAPGDFELGVSLLTMNKNLTARFSFMGDHFLELIPEVKGEYSSKASELLEAWLCEQGLFKTHFISNPYYQAELDLERKGYLGSDSIETPVEIKRLSNISNPFILLLADHHGKSEPIEKLHFILDNIELDWLALEMLHTGLNPHTGYTAKIRSYLDKVFVSFWKKAEMPYQKIMEKALSKGVRVIALDYDLSLYKRLDGNYLQANLIFRNYFWASRIPANGRGLIFGGATHFDTIKFPRQAVQSYLPKQKKRKVYLVK